VYIYIIVDVYHHGWWFNGLKKSPWVKKMFTFSSQAELYKFRTSAWETIMGVNDFLVCYTFTSIYACFSERGEAISLDIYHKRDMGSNSPKLLVVLFHMCDEKLQVMKRWII
jgi:hypothetical protein